MEPEQVARLRIDALLAKAGWQVVNIDQADIHAHRGVAIREFPLTDEPSVATAEPGEPGRSRGRASAAPRGGSRRFADYLLYVDGKAAGVIEAKKEGATLKGVEFQSKRYGSGLPASLPAHRRPLPFLYESTGVETQFTNGLDPEPRSRNVFAFHRPEMLAEWLRYGLPARAVAPAANDEAIAAQAPVTFLARLQMRQAVADGMDVNDDVYRIKTEVTEAGATMEAGYWLQVLDKPIRARRPTLASTQLDDSFEYAPKELDRSVQTPDQIRTIARTLRDRWQTELFPQRSEAGQASVQWTLARRATTPRPSSASCASSGGAATSSRRRSSSQLAGPIPRCP